MNRRILFFWSLICAMMIYQSAMAEEQLMTSSIQTQIPAALMPHPGPPVISALGPAGGTFPKGAFGAVLNYALADKNRSFHHSSREYRLADGKKVHTAQNMLTAKLRYGLGGGWDIRTATPIAYNRLHNNPAGLSKKRGVGDTLVILHKQFMSQAQGKPLDLAFGIGAWGGWGELGMSYAFDNGRHLLEAELGYLWRGHGGHAENYGKQSDLLRANARYAFAVSRHMDAGVEAQVIPTAPLVLRRVVHAALELHEVRAEGAKGV